ncbi:MAG: ParB/RepB/Spo0J family partition protein, partial [Pseudobdellovibrionaceae bacterium]
MSDMQNTETGAKKKGLGRGLGSLLGDNASYAQQTVSSAPAPKPTINNIIPPVAPPVATVVAPQASNVKDDQRIWMIPVEKISPNEFQPRQTFDKEKLEELARSIKEKGILQPISARKSKNGTFEIIAGERRWRAAQIAGMHEVPVIIRESSNQDSLELAIIENVQRADLDPIEEAEAFQKLGADFHLTQQQIADKVGKERATVANALRLLLLPQEIKEMVRTSMVSAGHAKVLLGLNDSTQQK